MSYCDGCIKYLLFFFNLVFSLTGLALIIIGSLKLSNTSNFEDLIKDSGAALKTPQIFIIIVGVIIFFIATLGCCGAIRENRCMLITFAIFLLSIFIVELAIGIYALTHKDSFKSALEEGVEKEFQKIDKDPEIKKLFEKVEREMECCGAKGYLDYRLVVPGSCCVDKSDCKIKPSTYWELGCATALANFVGKTGQVLGGLAIGFSLIEVLGAIFALRLASKVR